MEHEHPEHNPGEPEFGEHSGDAPHNPGEPEFDEIDDKESDDDESGGES